MTRLSDDAWRARMEGKKTVREAAPLPLFDAKPDPVAEAGRLLVEGVKSAMPDIVPPPPPERSRPNDEASDPWARAHAGSALAARRWTPEEVARVDAAIRTAAATGREFTADDVWELLPGLLVTKGLAGRLMAAANAGLIRNTGKTAQARRGGEHDHAQRLSVWQGTGGAS